MDRVAQLRPRITGEKPGVESWFVRLNDPTRPRALWLKHTITVPRGGIPIAETWAIGFDGERVAAYKERLPLEAVLLDGDQQRVGPTELRPTEGASGGLGALSWELAWRPGALGAPLSLLPFDRMIDGGFPKNKLVTPFPSLRATGTVTVAGEVIDVKGWIGSLGHNWGARHAPEYAWAQVVFADDNGEDVAVVEGFSGRVALGPLRSPLLSSLVVRTTDGELRFDRLVDRWRHRVTLEPLAWTLRMRGRAGEALLTVRARPAQVASLAYVNPDDTVATCLNSKLASAELRVQPRNGAPFICRTEHGAALERLTLGPLADFPFDA